MNEGEVLRREADEEKEEMHADIETDGGGLGKEEILKASEMGMRTGTRVFFCRDEVGEKNVFAITDEN